MNMSQTVVPLWKQELLKRRERNVRFAVKHENSARPFEASSRSSLALNHQSARDVERNGDVPVGRQPRKVGGGTDTRKGTSVNHGAISQDGVDGLAYNDTRLQSETKSRLSSNHGIASRLDRSNDSSTQTKERTGKFNKNMVAHGSAKASNQEGTTSDVSRLDRQFCGDQFNNLSSITLDDDERDILKSIVANDRGVDSEHIRPKEVKRMWKRQESKEELHTQPQTSKDVQPKIDLTNHIEKPESMEVKKKHTTPLDDGPRGKIHQGNSSVPQGDVPKAYKSPYAKRGWARQTSTTGGRSPEKIPDEHPPQSNGIEKIEKKPALDTRHETSPKGDRDEKVQNDHIQSVKSLLGLFGGVAKVVCKHREDVKRNDGGYPSQAKLKTSDHSKYKLVRHHSEPNLYTQPRKSPNAQSSQAKVSGETASSKPVGQSSHNVSVGIKERMSRLRKASHSSMEDLRIDSENVEIVAGNSQNAKTEVEEDKILLPSKEHKVEPKYEPTADEKQNVNGNSTSHQEKDDLHIIVNKSTNEQLSKVETSSSPVDVLKDMNEVADMINSRDKIKENGHHEPLDNEESRNDAPKPSFDKLRSVFGAEAVKNATLNMNDSNGPKSSRKYPNKQNACADKGDQSGDGLGDQLVSTENSKGIMEDQQENKKVIKTEENIQEHHVAVSKVEKKPRKSLLNVVDPLEVLQLTKDPILSKGKPISADLGLIKEPQSGRKPTVEIIKSQPDTKNKIAQINRAWDLNHVQPAPPPRVNSPTMPSNSSPQTPSDVLPQSRNIPVTSIDEIPVSSIDEVAVNNAKSGEDTAALLHVGNTTFYTGPQSSESSNHESEPEEEFIPVSSIDDDDDPRSLIPPEIVFEKNPENVRSCFISGGMKKRGNVSFFQHVFIHDYQSESSAVADWDFENGQAFSSYTPAAVRQYEEIDMAYMTKEHKPPPVTPFDNPTMPEDPPNDVGPTAIYNEEESMGFTESSDSTCGALLF